MYKQKAIKGEMEFGERIMMMWNQKVDCTRTVAKEVLERQRKKKKKARNLMIECSSLRSCSGEKEVASLAGG